MARHPEDQTPDVRPVVTGGRRGPGAPGAVAVALIAMAALFTLSTGGDSEQEVTTTTVFTGIDQFDPDVQSTTTTGPPSTTPTRAAAEIDAFMQSSMLDWVGAFWAALGAGDLAAADRFLDRPAAQEEGLGDLVGFLTSFSAEFTATGCEPIGANGVMCDVTALDPAITTIGITGPTAQLTVGMGSSGLAYVQTPPVVASAAQRLAVFARERHGDDLDEACDPDTTPEEPLPIRIGTLAATPRCGEFLARLVPEYLVGDQSSVTGQGFVRP